MCNIAIKLCLVSEIFSMFQHLLMDLYTYLPQHTTTIAVTRATTRTAATTIPARGPTTTDETQSMQM